MEQNGIKDYRIVMYNMMAIIVSHLSASRHFGFTHHTVRIRSVTRGGGGEGGGEEGGREEGEGEGEEGGEEEEGGEGGGGRRRRRC